MKHHSFEMAGCVALCVLAPALAGAQEAVTKEQLVKEFTALLTPAIQSTDRLQTHGFSIEASRVRQLGTDLKLGDNVFNSLIVKADGSLMAQVVKGVSGTALGGGVSLYQRQSGTPLLTTGDDDGDGRLDFLSYTVVDDKGEAVVEVIDYEADGQSDLRVNFREHRTEIWHLDRWQPVENREGVRGIVLDGRFVPLRRDGNRLRVP